MDTLIQEMTAIEGNTRELMKKKGLSIRAFCAAVGINSNTLYDIFEKGYGKIPTLERMADVLGVTRQELEGVLPVKFEENTAKYISTYTENLIEIPFVSRAATASFIDIFTSDCMHEWREEMFRYFQDKSADLKLTARHMIFEVVGDSMEPTLNEGSYILTERTGCSFDSLESGVYVVMYDSKLVVKRIINNEILSHGFLTLHSDNPRHGSQPIRVDELRCTWRVLEVVRQKVK